MFYIATAIFNLALAVTTISDVVAEGFRHAARRRRIIAKRRKQRREERRALRATRKANEFIYHGGGKYAHDPMKHNDMLHVSMDKGFKDAMMGILMFWKKKRHHDDLDDDEEEEDNDDIWREVITTADEGTVGTPIAEEDKHLFMPRTMSVNPDDPDVRNEIVSQGRKDNIQRVRSFSYFNNRHKLIRGRILCLVVSWAIPSSLSWFSGSSVAASL